MSRGFVKEDDQEEAAFIPPRAPLPDGMINYVTQRGLQLLTEERGSLEKERQQILDRSDLADDERRRDLAVLNGKLDLLADRIATAQLIELESDLKEVRFGTVVTFRHRTGVLKGKKFTFALVGVDEADVKLGLIAFTAPIARALIGKGTTEVAEFQLGEALQQLEILQIARYTAPSAPKYRG
ncbi:MAG: GreA/GreB family elongation factor [Bacteroidota bacterium]|nr:GreA/GreB family elongation factor [Bacteroidota bacterium]